MNLLKNVKLTGMQVGLLKLSSIAFGIAIATTWPELFTPFSTLAWVVAVVAGLYIAKVWMDQ
jgi:hypothetical protein